MYPYGFGRNQLQRRRGSPPTEGTALAYALRRARGLERRDRRRARRRARRRGNARAEGRLVDGRAAGRHRAVALRWPRRHAELLVLRPADQPVAVRRWRRDARRAVRADRRPPERGCRDRRPALAHRVGGTRPRRVRVHLGDVGGRGHADRRRRGRSSTDSASTRRGALELTDDGHRQRVRRARRPRDARRLRRRERAGGASSGSPTRASAPQMTNLPIAFREQAVDARRPSEWVPPTEPPATPTAGTLARRGP